jgi:hypothetical protein
MDTNLYITAGAALLTAVSPHLLNANVYILTESAAAFSIVVFLWLYALSTSYLVGDKQLIFKPTLVSPPSWQKFVSPWFLLGLAIAAGTLIRPTLQWFLLPLLGIVYALPVKDSTTPWKRFVLVVFGFIVVMLPWWIRNILQFSELSNSSLMINTLHHGMYPNFTYEGHPESFGFPYRFDPRSPEIAASLGSVIHEIVRRFIADPAQHLYWFLVGKILMFWNWSNDAQGAGDVFIYPMLHTPFTSNLLLSILHEIMRFLHVPLVVIGMISSVSAWLPIAKRRVLDQGRLWFWRTLSAVLLYFVAIHMVGAPFPRYNIPVLPVLYMQVMLTLSLAGEYFRNHKYDEATATRSLDT